MSNKPSQFNIGKAISSQMRGEEPNIPLDIPNPPAPKETEPLKSDPPTQEPPKEVIPPKEGADPIVADPIEPAKETAPVETEAPKTTAPSEEEKEEEIPATAKGQREALIKARQTKRDLEKKIKETETGRAELESKVKELESRLAEKPKPETDPEALKLLQQEVESLKREREEMEVELSKSRVESTREYKQAVVEPFEKTVRPGIESLAKAYEIDPKQIVRAFNIRDRKQRNEALEDLSQGMSRLDQVELLSLYQQYNDLAQKRETILNRPKEALKISEEQRKQEEEKLTIERRTKYTEGLKRHSEKIEADFPFLKKGDNQKLNEIVEKMNQDAEKVDVDAMPPETRAVMVQNAMKFPMIVSILQYDLQQARQKIAEFEQKKADELKTLNDEITTLKTENKRLLGATPGAGADTGRQKKDDYVDPKGITFGGSVASAGRTR